MPLDAAGLLPFALAITAVLAVERRRERRRRLALNRALHELRRPLQVLALTAAAAPQPPVDRAGRGQLDAAIAALEELDAAVNGGPRKPGRRALRADELAAAALERWSTPAALLDRQLELRWRAGPATVVGEPVALDRALDNLLANALEHGARRIRLEGTARWGKLRIAVTNPGRTGAGELAGPLRRHRGDSDPRRGHGLGVVAEIAAAHHGRFLLSSAGGVAKALLELPLAYDPGATPRSRSPDSA